MSADTSTCRPRAIEDTGGSPRRVPSAAGARGVFVAFEGGDGAGKTTQIQELARRLRNEGHGVHVTREPGGTALGAQIRHVLLHGDHVGPRAEALLFAADRAHHVETLVEPALAAGDVVLTDRFMDSSIAYQGAGRRLDADEVRRISLWATGGLVPDLTVLLDVTPGAGRARRGAVHDRLESEPDDFHGRVRDVFLQLAASAPSRYLVLDADRDVPDLAEAVHERVRALLGGGLR